MKVLSFDVGIKNLAACVLEWDNSNDLKSNLKIHYWEIINLLSSHSKSSEKINNYICCGKDSKKNICDKKAKSFVEFNGIKYCFCTKHLNSKDELLNPLFESYSENNWIQEKNLVCETCNVAELANSSELVNPSELANSSELVNVVKVKVKTDRKTYFANKSLKCTLCSKHYKIIMGKIETAKTKIYPIKNKKVKDMTSDDLKFHLVKCLDERKEYLLLNVDMVLIENQPTFKNPTMKAISDTLYTWFMIRGIVDKELNNSTIQKIRFISPSNKLKEFDQKTIEEATEAHKYKETKKLSIENTKTILLSYGLNQWIDVIMSHQKKDDLADSFLQGWYILNNMNEDKLYSEWRILYDMTVLKVADLVENKTTSLKKGLKINLTESAKTKSAKTKSAKSTKSAQNVLDLTNF